MEQVLENVCKGSLLALCSLFDDDKIYVYLLHLQ